MVFDENTKVPKYIVFRHKVKYNGYNDAQKILCNGALFAKSNAKGKGNSYNCFFKDNKEKCRVRCTTARDFTNFNIKSPVGIEHSCSGQNISKYDFFLSTFHCNFLQNTKF